MVAARVTECLSSPELFAVEHAAGKDMGDGSGEGVFGRQCVGGLARLIPVPGLPDKSGHRDVTAGRA